jgi:hypothetical protein
MQASFIKVKHLNIKVCLLQKTFPQNIIQYTNGFFVTGRNDHTACFHCGVYLKEWEASDSVWEQHSKWSPNCFYVAHNKGIEFVLHKAQVLKTAQGF